MGIATHLTGAAVILLAGVLHSAGARAATGPLRVHPANPRYFTDGTTNAEGSLKAVYLAGSHTWANLIDRGPADPPARFDFPGYLNLLQEHEHNFIRLWGRHVTWYHGYGEGELRASPLAWARTGPGLALDGKPRFDLARFNPEYFERLRTRVAAAAQRGIYVGVMLFGGSYECRDGWRGNPFHRDNNINGINGDPSGDGAGIESHTLSAPAITRLQEAYVRKVIDTLNDLDNVLYEIANEADGSSAEWQQHLVRFIREYEGKLPRQHPVGMTALYVDDPKAGNDLLRRSAADWISPQTDAAEVRNHLPVADGSKVSLLDSDHWFVKEIYGDPAFGREWVWKAFCRGYNPILMEHLPPLSFVDADYPVSAGDPGYTAARRAMRDTRRFSERINLAAATPRNDLASTGYCLAAPGREYLVYVPEADTTVSVELIAGRYDLECFSPSQGAVSGRSRVTSGGGRQQFRVISPGGTVLYLKRSDD